MVLVLDQITRKKLVTIRYLYQEGLTKSLSIQNVANKIISVINFDLSTETALYLIVSLLDPQKNPKDFPEKTVEADRLMNANGYGNLPERSHIIHVHSVRNDAQHKAKYPNDSDISDCRTYTRDFLETVVKTIWGIEFQKITLTDLIKHKKTKAYLLGAEGAFRKRKYEKTVELAAAGLDWALTNVGRPFVGGGLEFTEPIAIVDRFQGNAKGSSDVTTAIQRMQRTLKQTALGLNTSDYIRFKQISGSVMWAGGRHWIHHVDNMKTGLTPDEAEYVLNYAINSVVQIEGLVGDIDTPFGTTWW